MNEKMLKLAETFLAKLEELSKDPTDTELEKLRRQIDLLWQLNSLVNGGAPIGNLPK